MISNKLLKIASVLIFTQWILGCISSRFAVKTDPVDAEVFVRSFGSDEKKLIGKTPINMTLVELQNQTKVSPVSGEFFEIVIEKQGFQSERVLVPGARMGHIETIVMAKLKPGESEGRLAHKLLQHLFNAQKLANDREFERAQMELDKAFELDPTFVRGMSMRGSILFVQQKYDESLKWFQKALNADPQFEDAIKMIAQVKKILGDSQTPNLPTREPGSQ